MNLNLFKLGTSFKSRISIFAIAIIISLIGNPLMVLANTDDYSIKSVYLSIRPEFDFPADWADEEIPAVLIVNQIEVVNNTNEPLTSFNYPAPIDEPYFSVFAVGKLQAQGQYWPAPYILSEGKIHVDLKDYPINPNEDYTMVVQYYYHPFEIDGAKKSFSFEYAPDFTVDEVNVHVAIPPAGKNARIEPAKYALEPIAEKNVNKDNPINITVMYDKADNKPTNNPLTQNNKASGGKGSSDMLFLVFIAILLAGVAIFLFAQKSDTNNKKDKQRPKRVAETKTTTKQQVKTTTKQSPKPASNKQKKSKDAASEEQINLRKQLLAGEIDEATYQAEIKKINQLK